MSLGHSVGLYRSIALGRVRLGPLPDGHGSVLGVNRFVLTPCESGAVIHNVVVSGGILAGQNTDWKRLRAITEAEIRAGIEADPDAQPTDEEFWKDAKVVRPKE